MKKFIVLMLLVILTSCSSNVSAEKNANVTSDVIEGEYYVVTADLARLWSAPMSTSDMLGSVNRGTVVLVLNAHETDSFAKIMYEGKEVYINSYYIKKQSEVEKEEKNNKKEKNKEETTQYIESTAKETIVEVVKNNGGLSADNYPVVDGSTANMPLMAQIRSDVLSENIITSQNKTAVSTTDYAWRSLIRGDTDLLLVYEASSETKRIIEESETKLIVTPIGVDALVFIENENNVVNNLTTRQIQEIYTGIVDNWKDVGGSDNTIKAFQRPLNSGSQTLFLNLVMKGITPKTPLKNEEPGEMGTLIDVIASYNNTANAIGYSVFYYAKKMYQVPGLKLISIDGVMPSDETIGNGTYPFVNKFYLVIREDTPEDSPTRKLYNYILSDKGRESLIKAGYIPYKKP